MGRPRRGLRPDPRPVWDRGAPSGARGSVVSDPQRSSVPSSGARGGGGHGSVNVHTAIPVLCTVGLVTAASWGPHSCRGVVCYGGDFVSPATRFRVPAVHPHGQCPKVPQQWLPASCAGSPIQLRPHSPPHAVPLWVTVTSGRRSPAVPQ